MPRLIDFDKLMEQYDFYNEFAVHDLRYLKKEYLPFVEAIPIEWMQQMIEEGKASGHIDEYGEYQEGTTLGESCEHVLANWYNTYKWKWEKENEN